MKEHILETQMELPLKLTEVFPFFCDTVNLERITPPELHFQITTPQATEITLGTVIDYKLQLYTIRFRWRSEIIVWRPPYEFVDEQIQGPYRLWIHRHQFYEKTDLRLSMILFGINYHCGHWAKLFFPCSVYSLDVYLNTDNRLYRLPCWEQKNEDIYARSSA